MEFYLLNLILRIFLMALTMMLWAVTMGSVMKSLSQCLSTNSFGVANARENPHIVAIIHHLIAMVR